MGQQGLIDNDRGRDGKQLFSHEVATRTKFDDKHPEQWMETTINYLVGRSHLMEELLEWVVKQQLNKIDDITIANAPAGMYDPTCLSRNLWEYLNLATANTTQQKEFLKVKRLNGLEAWRRIVVPLKPRSEAKRNALHTAVHTPPKSKSLATIIGDLDDWERVLDEFELCGGNISESDKRTILLKKLPTTVHSSMVSSLRKCTTYEAMKSELEAEITFLRDCLLYTSPSPRD